MSDWPKKLNGWRKTLTLTGLLNLPINWGQRPLGSDCVAIGKNTPLLLYLAPRSGSQDPDPGDAPEIQSFFIHPTSIVTFLPSDDPHNGACHTRGKGSGND